MATTRFLVVALALAFVPACDDDDDDFVVVGDPVGDAIDEGVARGTVLANDASAELSPVPDQRTVLGKTATILATLNDGEIQQAQFAIQVVQFDDTADLANIIIIDHTEANAVLDDVVRGLGVPFIASSTADALAADAAEGLGLLRATPPSDIDFQYTQMQVIMHSQALVLLDELEAQVGPGVMADYIDDTRVMINDHLTLSSNLLETFFD